MNIILLLSIFCIIQIIFCTFLLWLLNKASYRIMDMNKKLLILAMGREKNTEGLKALVASDRPPRKNLPGIATNKKEIKQSKNINYEMTIGLPK